MALSGELPRRAIRRIARHAAVRHFLHIHELYAGVEGLKLVGLEHLERAIVDGGGAIVAPFHFGGFRLTAPALLARGHCVALLATKGGSDPLTRDVPLAFAGKYGQPLDADGVAERYLPIDSTSPTSLWTACCAVRAGRIVVLYPDGNTGVDERTPDASCHTLSFLGRRIAVRTGVAALAMATGRPVVPAIGREGLGMAPELCFEEPILRDDGEPRHAFRARVIDTLFRRLEVEVRRAPDRWEQWPFAWQWTDRTPLPVEKRVEPASIDVHALASRRLRLANPYLWPLDLSGRTFVIDLSTWNSLGSAPMLVALVEAAAQDATVGGWLRTVPQDADAAAMLGEMMRMGAVEVG
jgi:lauroyl/myristoyl acyltransferase